MLETNTSISVLHISDLQFGKNHRFDSSDGSCNSLSKRLVADLIGLNKGIRPDIIVVSGDLMETGSKDEYNDALSFLREISRLTQIATNRVIIIPGNHDINWNHCQAYFHSCEGDEMQPKKPYWPKWKYFSALFDAFYSDYPDIQFSEAMPWTIYKIPELHVVFAGLNSTMEESHKDEHHYGFVGENQLNLVNEELEQYVTEKWLRIGVVHHNVLRKAINDDENLRDSDDLRRILSPRLNCILHGHTHQGSSDYWSPICPILSTGSAALKTDIPPEGIGNQYQIITFKSNGIVRYLRRFDPLDKRWIGDTRSSDNGNEWIIKSDINFENVETTFFSNRKATPNSTNRDGQLIDIHHPVDITSATKCLKNVPRFLLKVTPQHRCVRKEAVNSICNILARQSCVWLVADWNHGKEGFLAVALDAFYHLSGMSNIFRIQCGAINTWEDVLREAELQFGLSFQEFVAAAGALDNVALVLEDLPSSITTEKERESFEQRLRVVSEFAPNLKIVCISRTPPSATVSDQIVVLGPLEESETRYYLGSHESAQPGLEGENELERIFRWSEGLPAHLDRLLDRFPMVPLSEILDEASTSKSKEPIPQSLVNAVSTIASSENEHSQMSFLLLKVLTVLKDGETFRDIKRFYKKPFYPTNIDELIDLRLLQNVPISQASPNLGIKLNRNTLHGNEAAKLLRVPRQVRDYVNTFLSVSESNSIIEASTELFFGPDWWKGKIRLRNPKNLYSSIPGPGNEHVIIGTLLANALQIKNTNRVDKYARVALAYCHKLYRTDRFRDCLIASQRIMELFEGFEDHVVHYIEVSYLYAKSKRMTGDCDEALKHINKILDIGDGYIIDEFRSQILLSKALALKKLDRVDQALECAKLVQQYTQKQSDEDFQAESLIAELTLDGGRRIQVIEELEKNARHLQKTTAANNMAIFLAKESKEPTQALEYLKTVIYSCADEYSRARAIIEKASILIKHIGISNLNSDDYTMLDAAYAYSYSQRIGNLLDRCHSVLWTMLWRDKLFASLIRLFRYSSFIWGLKGAVEKEKPFLIQLKDLDLRVALKSDSPPTASEIEYVTRRFRD